ncbi:hypothetical protein B0T16DRAFT_400258 [Cercophora newfieldiana]|uniref:F-box domain-containing protein n=1 Tax=Cercophora newfieldiana TaxID=92897 RepID=A0AA39YQM0_9PEZI|nr:hypothetical protein B0T16DRAFT_400258 [Cercophora newfieldiana]
MEDSVMDIASAPDAAALAAPQARQEQASKTVSGYLGEKGLEWKAVYDKERPLTLLELPVDILRLIVKEITHTNDLTALALTSSALYNLAVPLIYSRFDIVWPDGIVAPSESKSVDALTYGLSTLCLGSAFARTTRKVYRPSASPLAKFAGNEYAKYTKKFSLGNGPNDWVAEYMITKESGKMLGTLVAIAVAKMKNLETFVWDMPTGVLSDIFMALSSLEDQTDNDCKLNRVWIRWHDNSENLAVGPSSSNPAAMSGAPAVVPLGSQLTPIGIMLPPTASHPPPRPAISYLEYHCEYPTFSVLPPLKSLTVLDIDELGYLDEIAVLLERSKDCLQELRIGIAAKAAHKDFVQTWDGPGLKQIDHRARWPGESSIGERRLGGVLGVLVGKIYDIKKRRSQRGMEKPAADALVVEVPASPITPVSTEIEIQHDAASTVGEIASSHPEIQQVDEAVAGRAKAQTPVRTERQSRSSPGGRRRLDGKLKLQTLELERVPLSLQVCRLAFDWSLLSSLTLLDCAQHESLWKMLRKQFQPSALSFGAPPNNKQQASAPLQYHLALKYIHTDTTSPSLITFIKETLAPNTLEVLFLQDRRRGHPGPPTVMIDHIFKGALKRHRSSLQKLLLDSSAKLTAPSTTAVADAIRWRNWVLTTEMVLYITSGRMCNLKELAVSLDYKDWVTLPLMSDGTVKSYANMGSQHTFLQRLPNVPQLRSINIPHIADYVTNTFEPRELAHQIADIITLRPEIRLCYAGIGAKCFEILEACDAGSSPGASGTSSPYVMVDSVAHGQLHGSGTNDNGAAADHEGEDEEDTTDEEDDEGEDDDSEESEDEEDDNTPTTGTSDPDEMQSDNEAAEHDDDSDDDGFVEPDNGRVSLRLREILFYDDKVAIFRARHGKL